MWQREAEGDWRYFRPAPGSMEAIVRASHWRKAARTDARASIRISFF
jgi:hypothetical protein